MSTQSFVPGQPGYVPRNGNEAQAARTRECATMPAPQPTALSNRERYSNGSLARAIVYRAGLPAAAIELVQHVLNAELETQNLRAALQDLTARLMLLEVKAPQRPNPKSSTECCGKL
jgi:hypothetical protein